MKVMTYMEINVAKKNFRKINFIRLIISINVKGKTTKNLRELANREC